MLKTPTGWAIAALVVAVVILGPAALMTTIRGAWNRGAKMVEDAKSFEQHVAEGEDLVSRMAGESDRASRDVAQVVWQANAAKRQVAANEKKKTENDAILRRIDALLTEGRDSYEIGSRRYSRRELETDALRRVEAARHLEADLTEARADVEEYEAAAREGQQLLAELERERQARAQEIERLKRDYVNAKRRGDIAELRRTFQRTATNVDGELARKLELLRQRVWAANHRADALSADVRGGVIDWTGDSSDEDARAAIKTYFGTDGSDGGG